MERKQLERLAVLGTQFKNAVEAGLDQRTQVKIMQSLQPGELEKNMAKFQSLATEALEISLGRRMSDDFIKRNIEIVEIVADMGLSTVPAERLAKYVPHELKNDADAEAFTKLNAPKLASLCKIK